MKPRTLLMLALFLGAAGVSQADPQTAPPVPARQQPPSTVPGNPAKQQLPSTVPANPSKQAASEPEPTKIIRIYRGKGYFDNALAEKLRPVLTGSNAADQGASALERSDNEEVH